MVNIRVFVCAIFGAYGCFVQIPEQQTVGPMEGHVGNRRMSGVYAVLSWK